jgi:hypothetical protein
MKSAELKGQNYQFKTNINMKTKTSILVVTKAFFILLVMCCFLSCSSNFGTNYTYKWKLAVVYTNGEKDTVNCQYDSFKGNECYLTLKISESGLLSSGGTEPCIIMGCGFYSEPVVCGVRKYEVLNLDKVLLK